MSTRPHSKYIVADPNPLTLIERVPQYSHHRGYAATREKAMADFKTRWVDN